jgi:hypothetical protein
MEHIKYLGKYVQPYELKWVIGLAPVLSEMFAIPRSLKNILLFIVVSVGIKFYSNIKIFCN